MSLHICSRHKVASESQVLPEASLAKEERDEFQVCLWLLCLWFSSVLQQFPLLSQEALFQALSMTCSCFSHQKKIPGITLVDLDANWECGPRLVRTHIQSGIWAVIPFLGDPTVAGCRIIIPLGSLFLRVWMSYWFASKQDPSAGPSRAELLQC